jgi:hypothetical protein
VEGLPELFNGTLEPERKAQLHAHLAACGACRAEWEETRLGAAVFDTHLPADAIVAMAWDRAPTSVESSLAQQHVESCSECADDLAAARESRARETEFGLPPAPRKAFGVLPATLAAALAVVAFGAGVYWGEARARPQVVATDSTRAPEALSPQLNLPVLELLPGSSQSRQAAPSEPELVIGAGDSFAALLLSVQTQPRPVTIELRNEKGIVLWKGAGLRPSALGGYSVGLPAELLEDGAYSIVLSLDGRPRPAETFSFRVRRRP